MVFKPELESRFLDIDLKDGDDEVEEMVFNKLKEKAVFVEPIVTIQQDKDTGLNLMELWVESRQHLESQTIQQTRNIFKS